MPANSDSSDNLIVKQLKDGSKDAFKQLYNQYADRIHRFAYGYLKSDFDAEELVQEVFIKLWNNRQKLDSSQNLKSYFFKIAVNTVYDFIRRKNVEQAFQEFLATESSSSNETWQEVVYQDMLSQIERFIKMMPEQRQRIFSLSREKGLSNDEIAEALNLSKRTVENQLYRATAFLKKNLKMESGLAVLFFYLFC